MLWLPQLEAVPPSMSTSTNFLFPSYNYSPLHFQHRFFFSSFPLPSPRLTISKLNSDPIRASKFDFNSPQFHDDYDYDDDYKFKPRKRRGASQKQRKVPWWSDILLNDDDDDDAAAADVDSGFLEQLVDNLFILQVFKSYGWFLPVILLSFITATGPKAFLLGSGILFGLSIILSASRMLWEWLEGSPKTQKRPKKRSRRGRRKGVFIQEDDLEEEIRSGTRTKRRDFQSWVSRNNGTFYEKDNSNEVGSNGFGGWDELVREDETQKIPRETERLERMMEKEKERLSRSMEERDLPLLLKILIAVFPFLASWTTM